MMTMNRFYRWLLALLCLVLFSGMVAAEPCRDETFEGNAYIVCSFDVSETDLRMFWRNQEGTPYRTFSALADDLADQGLALAFATNGGMYQADLTPLGLYIENGRTLKSVNSATLSGGPAQVPNFYKQPNGIFFLGNAEAGVMETGAFLQAQPETEFATQSGPMLVINGAIHPVFNAGSTARRPRNGVGLSSPTEVHFAISQGSVNFHDFAHFFRDKLGCDNALYLDGGSAPGLYAPGLGRNDLPGHGGYGPIIGVVEQTTEDDVSASIAVPIR